VRSQPSASGGGFAAGRFLALRLIAGWYFLPPTPSFRHALARTALFFGGIGGRISQSEMRRKKGCCPCPTQPVRGQRQGTPFCLYECE